MRHGRIDKIGSSQAQEDFLIKELNEWTPRGGQEKIKTITFNRNLADANNTVAYTGLGFKPSFIIFHGNVNNTMVVQISSYDGTTKSLLFYGSSGWNRSIGASADAITGFVSAGNSVAGTIDSFDSDGFTISWVKTGSPTGTMNFSATCFR